MRVVNATPEFLALKERYEDANARLEEKVVQLKGMSERDPNFDRLNEEVLAQQEVVSTLYSKLQNYDGSEQDA